MPSQTEWDRRYLRMAREVSDWSKDPSTGVGAILVDPEYNLISTGYNGFASKVRDTPERLNNRTLKLKLTLHGEENAIINAGKAGRMTRGATCYVWPMPPCAPCASKLAQAGVLHIISVTTSPDHHSRWGEDISLAQEVYSETGMDLLIYEQEFLDW